MCGGTHRPRRRQRRPGGLSPRVRGNRSVHIENRTEVGSIPACAGEPLEKRSDTAGQTVYPRVCGGTIPCAAAKSVTMGLSPRVRGNRQLHLRPGNPYRSIPACAGEPPGSPWLTVAPKVYPRVCGGTKIAGLTLCRYQGLSPRVRGNRAGTNDWRLPHRSIPACAGEPSICAGVWLAAQVYPRVCGGTVSRRTSRCVSSGLSPRVRGNLIVQYHTGLIPGSIPACAGEPL